MKPNPNEFKPGDQAILDEKILNAQVVIHELTDTQILAIISRPGAPKEEWWVVQTRRLSPIKTNYANN